MQYIVDEPIEGFDIYKALQDSKTKGGNIAHMKDIRSLMETVHFTLDEAMDALKIPEEDREEYAKMLAAENNTAE